MIHNRIFCFITMCIFSAFGHADIYSSSKPLSIEELRKINEKKAGESTIADGNYRTVFVSSSYLDQIKKLRAYARTPSEEERNDKYFPQFCQCVINAVLDESANRKAYFFKSSSDRLFSDIMLTVDRYKKDGGDVEFGKGAFNASINGNSRATLALARVNGGEGGIIKVLWYKGVDGPDAKLIELVARIPSINDDILSEMAKFLQDAVNKIDKAFP